MYETGLEFPKIKTTVDHHRNHSSAAIGAGNFYPIRRRIDNARAIRDGLVHFESCDILSLPAEGIADPIDKVEIATCIDRHQIAGTEPGIADGEYIAKDFCFGLGGIGIALETATTVAGQSDPANSFTGF